MKQLLSKLKTPQGIALIIGLTLLFSSIAFTPSYQANSPQNSSNRQVNSERGLLQKAYLKASLFFSPPSFTPSTIPTAPTVQPPGPRMANSLYAYPYENDNNYFTQSCYHPMHAADLYKRTFCDKEKCTFPDGQYCEHRSKKCYDEDGTLIVDENGNSVTDSEGFVFINWSWCMDEEGSIIPPKGEQPYINRFEAGCSYNVTDADYHEPMYAGKIDFLVKCDDHRCIFPGGGTQFDLKKKTFSIELVQGRKQTGKTPVFTEFLTIDWTCKDAYKVPNFPKNLMCYNMWEENNPSNCELCYEKNKKFTYKQCLLPYDKLGRRADVPRALHSYDIDDEFKRIDTWLTEKMQDESVPWNMMSRANDSISQIYSASYNLEEITNRRIALLFSRFLKRVKTPSMSQLELRREIRRLEKLINRYLPQDY